jgi:hypothetical protein
MLCLVTDPTIQNPTTTFNLGSDGQWDAFEQASNMFFVYSAGNGPFTFYLNKTAIRTAEAGGAAISSVNPAVTESQIVPGSVSGTPCSSSCTVINNAGRAVWSRVPGETYTFYELWGDGLTVYRDVINPSTDTFSRTAYTNLGSAFPQTYYSTWNGVFTVATDGSIALTMAGGMDWQGSHAYAINDYTSFIFPQSGTGYASKHAFRATVAGTTSGSAPNWTTCITNGTCTDGGVTWTDLGSINGQGPGFDAVVYLAGSASYRSLNTRLGQIRTGTTVSGTWTTTDTAICNKYGTNPCPLTDLMTLHGNGADLNSAYMSLTPTHGGGTPVLTPGTANCLNTNSNYLGAYSGATAYHSSTHDTVYDPSHGAPYSYYVATANTTGNAPPNASYWALADVYCYTYHWQVVNGNVNVSTQTSAASHTSGHQAQGYLNYWGDTDQFQHSFSQPMVYQSVSGTIDEVPYPTASGSSSTGWVSYPILPNGFPSDHHDSYRDSGTTDTPPITTFATDVPTIETGTGFAAGYGEVVGECNGLGTCPIGTMYRFAHEYNTGGSAVFANQNNIGVSSQDGQWALWGTDVMGTRGSVSPDWIANHAYALGTFMYPTVNNGNKYDWVVSTAGTSAPSTEPNWNGCSTTCADGTGTLVWTRQPGACNQLRAGFAPAASTLFAAGSSIYPVSNNANNDIYYTAAGGTTGSPVPNWGTFCPNYGSCPTLDGTVQWVNKGANDCRSDAMLVDLTSAGSASFTSMTGPPANLLFVLH